MNSEKIFNVFKKEEITLDLQDAVLLDQLKDLTLEKNKVMNLTSITDEDDFIYKMILDSGILKKYFSFSNKSILDIGSGAGFPSLVLAILFKDNKFYPLDSTTKKINHIDEVKNKLGLNNVFPLNFRVEEYARNNIEKFDIVTARAVASLPILLELSAPLLKVDGYFIAYKGSSYLKELEESKNALKELDMSVIRIETFSLIGEGEKRAIIFFKKNKKTNKKYPREYNKIKKKPL